VRPLLETLLRSLPIAYAATDASEGTEVAIQIEGRGGGSWALVRLKGEWVLHEGRSKEAAATVSIDQDGAWRSLARNITVGEARKRAALSGKKALAQPFFGAVAVLVVPD
jgi:hypothetical protein